MKEILKRIFGAIGFLVVSPLLLLASMAINVRHIYSVVWKGILGIK
jgi:hypothetical protein